MDQTLEKDTIDYANIRSVARELAERLAARLREDGKGARTVTFKVRHADFTDVSRSETLKEATNENAENPGLPGPAYLEDYYTTHQNEAGECKAIGNRYSRTSGQPIRSRTASTTGAGPGGGHHTPSIRF